jgi:5'-deoxynucleotidase YfbR-like HD superfamily hydrolase
MASRISPEQVEQTLDAMVESLRLESLRRFWQQKFFEEETEAAKRAIFVEGWLPLESVAAHSWHVADGVLLVCPLAFQGTLNLGKAVALAVLHDKMEMVTGDWGPVGDGEGTGTHASHAARRAAKTAAVARYLASLPAAVSVPQAKLFAELAAGASDEARAVKAIDKLQGLVWVMVRKGGDISDEHLRFNLSYTTPVTRTCPEVAPFVLAAHHRMCLSVGDFRHTNGTELYERFAVELLSEAA